MTPQQLINFIKERYKARRGFGRTVKGNSKGINLAINYLKTLDSDVDVFTNYQIFFTLVTYFVPSLLKHKHESHKAIKKGFIAIIPIRGAVLFGVMPSILFSAMFIDSFSLFDFAEYKLWKKFNRFCCGYGILSLKIDPLLEICLQENATLDRAIYLNGYATSDVLKDILQEAAFQGRPFSLGKQLLDMPYKDFTESYCFDELFHGYFDAILKTPTHLQENFSESDWECIQNSAYPTAVFHFLAHLSLMGRDEFWMRLESPESKVRFSSFLMTSQPDKLKKLKEGLRYLIESDDFQLLTEENIEMLLNSENSVFLEQCATFHLDRMPGHLRTQGSWDEILRLARESPNPTDAVNTYVAHQLELFNRTITMVHGDSQSTHKTSVHNSVALSLGRLVLRYSLSEEEIERYVGEFEALIPCLKAGDFKHLNQHENDTHENRCDVVAVRSIERILRLAKRKIFKVKEAQTGLSLKEIIALLMRAVLDEGSHISGSLDAKDNLIRGLFNIQRMYNYGSQNGKDKPSCDGGTINDLVTTLNAIHPDVIIVLINSLAIADYSLSQAKKVFWEKFTKGIPESADFIDIINQELYQNDWQSSLLKRLYTESLNETKQAIESYIAGIARHAKFTPDQIIDLNREIAPWVQINLSELNADKSMLVYIKSKYYEKNNLTVSPVIQDETPKDNFDKLLNAIDKAIIAEKQFRASISSTMIARQRFFSNVNFDKIYEFYYIIKHDRRCSSAVEWLQTGENHQELKKGIFGRSFKQVFLKEESDDEKPFSCTNIDRLDKCIEEHAVALDICWYPFAS